MLCCVTVSFRYGTEKFRDRKNDRNDSSTWVFSVCLEPYMFSSIFLQGIGYYYCPILQFNKQTWKGSANCPRLHSLWMEELRFWSHHSNEGFPVSPPLLLPVGCCLFVTATFLHSLFHCPENTCCSPLRSFGSHSQSFLDNFIHRCLPLGKIFQLLATNAF